MWGCRCSIVCTALVYAFDADRSVSAYTLRTTLVGSCRIAADRIYRRFFKGIILIFLPEGIFSGNVEKALFLYV